MATRKMISTPFPGESPTISLAMAAGQKYGLQPEEEKKPAAPRRAKAAGAKTRKAAPKKATKAATKGKASPKRK